MTTQNNYKKKCLDIFYASDVVNKELTFGCVIKSYCHPSIDYVVDDEYETNSLVGGKYATHERKNIEIIGHPPQLNNWLALLGNRITQRDFVLTDSELRYFHHHNKITKICFNLTTGQPSTEADWKALYELIK